MFLMDNRKIILVTLEYPPKRGGAGVYCEELAYAAVQLGVDFEVWSPKGSAITNGIKTIPFPFRGSQGVICSIRLVLEINKRIKKQFKPFIIHVAEPACLRAFIRFDWLLDSETDFYATIHGSELDRFTKFSIERRNFRRFLTRAKKIHVLSSYNERKLVVFSPESKQSICKFPGAPARRILPDGKTPQKTVNTVRILCVARIHPRKGQDYLLDVIGGLKYDLQKKIELCFVGPIIKQSFYKKLLEQNKKLICKVKFLGDLTNQQLKSEYEKSDLFVLTSLALADSVEGFGFVYLEASAHGLPILANQVGGVEDAVQSETTGILLEPNNASKMRFELERLIKDSSLRQKLGENGRKWASQHTWKSVAQNLFG